MGFAEDNQIDDLKDDIMALRAQLEKANAQTEEYERRYYLEMDKAETKDAEIALLRAILAPLISHADRHDYAPPYMLNVQQCREIREKVNGAN